MAYLYRLIFALLLSAQACAYSPTPAAVTYWIYAGFSTPLASCQDAAQRNMALNPGSTLTTAAAVSGSSCTYTFTWSGTAYPRAHTITTINPSCGSGGGTLSGGQCVCTAPAIDTGSACSVPDPNVAKCDAAEGGVDLFDGFSGLPTVGGSYCPSTGDASSCASTVVGGYCVIKAGVKKCTHEVKYSGATCTPPAPAEDSPVPTPCKGTYGQVNGVDVCLPLGSDPSVTVETGKKTTTTTTAPGGGSTTVTSDGTASCIGSQCTSTTTTTTTAPDGTSTSTTETKSESKDDFCKLNPRSPQCITSSFGGSCAANFTCDGDAVMCAITREQHIRNCKLFDDMSSTEAQLYNSEKGKAGEQTSTLPGSTSVQISSASFDTSDAIGAGSGCIADKSVTVAGSVVTLPFSSICGHLAMLGNILMAVSFLLAGRIVVRG